MAYGLNASSCNPLIIQFYVVYRIKSIYLQLNKAYSDRCPIVVVMHASFHLLPFFQSHNSSLFPSCWLIHFQVAFIVGISADCGQGYFLFLDLYFLANQVRPFWCLLGEFLTIVTKHFIVTELTCYRIYGQNSYPPSSPFNLFEMIYVLLEQLS